MHSPCRARAAARPARVACTLSRKNWGGGGRGGEEGRSQPKAAGLGGARSARTHSWRRVRMRANNCDCIACAQSHTHTMQRARARARTQGGNKAASGPGPGATRQRLGQRRTVSSTRATRASLSPSHRHTYHYCCRLSGRARVEGRPGSQPSSARARLTVAVSALGDPRGRRLGSGAILLWSASLLLLDMPHPMRNGTHAGESPVIMLSPQTPRHETSFSVILCACVDSGERSTLVRYASIRVACNQ